MKDIEFEPYGEEWEKECMKLPKTTLVEMLKLSGKARDYYRHLFETIKATFNEK